MPNETNENAGRPTEDLFVIQLGDGTFYVGPGAGSDGLLRTADPALAMAFGKRWLAVEAMMGNRQFAGSVVLNLENALKRRRLEDE